MFLDTRSWMLEDKKRILLGGIALLLGFTLPTSIAVLNITLALACLSLFISVRDFNQVTALAKNPLFYLPLLMFLMLLGSLLYTDNEFASRILSKYKKLLYALPIALFFLQDKRLPILALTGFMIGNTLVLIFSSLASLNWFNVFNIRPDNPTVFQLHITQNFFMAIACLVWLTQCLKHTGWQRIVYGLLFVLGIVNVLFLVAGRTGYLALAVGLGVLLWLMLKNKHRVVLVLSASILAIILLIVPNNAKNRIELGITEISRCVVSTDQNAKNACHSSMGLRTEFTKRSLALIKSSPWIGLGAGGFAYQRNPGENYWINPHNEYLIQTVHSGLLGLTLFLLWIVCLYRAAWQLPTQSKLLITSILSMYMASNFFNSFLHDAFESTAFMLLAGYLLASSYTRMSEKQNYTK